MTVADFTGAWAKFERAERHLRALERKIRIYIKSEPIVLVPKPNPNGSSEDFYFQFIKPIPDAFGLILGDCIHNLRSVLDHIAMSLAVNNGASSYNRTVYFPICRSPESFFGKDQVGSFEGTAPERTGRFKVRRLSREAQAFVEEMQYYHGKAESWPLIELDYLDNWDKHRAILTHAFRQLFDFDVTGPGVTIKYIRSKRIEDGAHFATVHYAAGYSGMKVKPPFSACISVERSNRKGFLIIPDFVRLGLFDEIRGILTEAERRFGTWGDVA